MQITDSKGYEKNFKLINAIKHVFSFNELLMYYLGIEKEDDAFCLLELLIF